LKSEARAAGASFARPEEMYEIGIDISKHRSKLADLTS